MNSSIVAMSVVIIITCWVLNMHYSTRNEQSKSKVARKQCRRQVLHLQRRNRKNERLKSKKSARSQMRLIEMAAMTREEKKELRERNCMQRVEQYQKLAEAQLRSVQVVVDLAFVTKQTIRERHSIMKQLGCAYGYLKTCPLDTLLSLQLTSCTHELAGICAQRGVLSWKIGRHVKPFQQLYDASKLVYLSPDSANVLMQFDPACVYVIGGIVDRSVRKGETMAKAGLHSIRTARLPLQEYFQESGVRVRTHIINIDSVIIALNEVVNHGDWVRAFERAVPLRITRTKGRHAK